MAGQTVKGVTDRHTPLVEIWVSELCDGQQDGPSQARRAVTDCEIPVWVGFLVKFYGTFLTILALIIMLVG